MMTGPGLLGLSLNYGYTCSGHLLIKHKTVGPFSLHVEKVHVKIFLLLSILSW